MPTMSFPYRLVVGEPYPVPMCDVYLLGPAGRVLIRSVVDSGAVRPIFPRKAAEDAGIQLPSLPNSWIQYGSGQTACVVIRAYIVLGEMRWSAEISFVDRLDFSYGLLGRRGVFAQFNQVRFLEKIAPSRVELSW